MSTDELTESLLQKSAENLAKANKRVRPSKTDVGAKVYVKLHSPGALVPAVVLETAYSHEGDYKQCRLKIAEYDVLNKQWRVSMYPKPVQSYKLRWRDTVIEGLDEA